ncbi:MAG: alpha/beta hydrolase [Proteobacteria bacterium]|nr:alpha/beta hydrolase [Pseudomonadota bacterium]MDA0983730.1 alpha/beta hydrolase [Pseudomonadota bacterium]
MTAASRQRFVQCASPRGLHRISYLEWGDPGNDRVLICAHGLTRCARDFDTLAAAMQDRYRVVCPDVAGRGGSDWLIDPMLYQLPQYLSDMVTLIARLDVEAVHWVGTSMGGLIGMALAAQPNTPVRRFVINDAGPVIAKVSLERIATYVGIAPTFPSIDAADQYVRAISTTFGPHSHAQWRFLTEVVVRRNDDGSWRMHYDPKLAEPFRALMPEKDLELWPLWDAVRCPTLALRGALSDLLTKETCAQMAERGPKAKVVEIPGVGHAPTLMHADQVAIVREFLLAA